MHSFAFASSGFSIAPSALPRTIGTSSPGKLYFFNNSRTSTSTKSNISGPSTMSTLFLDPAHVGPVHLPRQQHVLPPLRHRPVIRRHHQDRPVHLRRARDHVLDVVRVPRTVDVRVVPLLRLVLHVRHRDRDPPLPLLRRIVDRPVVPHRHLRVLRVQHLRDRPRQRRLPVLDV